MQFTAEQIAQAINGKIEGNRKVTINNFSKIEEGKPETISFLANPKYTSYIYDTKASIVIVNEDFIPTKPVNTTLIRVKDSYVAFATLLNIYEKIKPAPVGIDKLSSIKKSAVLGDKIFVGAFAVIGNNVKIGYSVQIHSQVFIGDNVTIGDYSIIYPGVKIYNDCVIGKNVTIHAGSVIGADGFGFAPRTDQSFLKVPQIGNVIIEDYVEIGANTTIDRATMGSTIIRTGVKIDNLVQVAHNVEIGENTVIAAQAGISGSTKIGKNCMIGGQVGIVGHIDIADEVKIGAQSGVANPLRKKGESYFGSPATEFSIQRRAMVIYAKLPDIWKRVDAIEKKINK